jgi:thiamine-monophosphate kinase
MREFDLINWIIARHKADPARVPVGPGDDCAVLNVGGQKLLVTTDQVLDGVHLHLAQAGPRACGRKAAARNLSDIAAMAGEPLAMTATLALPAGFRLEQAQEIYFGLCEMGEQFGCPLVGGDLAAWTQAQGSLQISVTMLGLCRQAGPILRGGAKPGDALCVTGQLGGAWRSGRDLSFVPRVREAQLLAQEYDLHAMIDITDGLAADLAHLARASGLAGQLDAAAIPIHDDALRGPDPLAWALHDGEDYELLFALPEDQAQRLLAQQPLPVKVARIGTMLAGEGLTIIRGEREEILQPRGWEHTT